MTKRHAEIAGAGIAGLASATALAQRGWSVRVHERSPNLRTFGAGIYIWSNGLHVLKALGAYDEAVIGAHEGPEFHTRDHLNETMEEIPINGNGPARLITILRETLLTALLNAARRAGVEVVTGAEAVGATPEGELLLADGKRLAADLVIGADGINSKVRDSLDLMMYRKPLGYGAVRMMIKRDSADAPVEDLPRYIEHFSGSRRILYTPASETDLYIALCASVEDEAAYRTPVDTALWTESFPHLASLIARFGDAGRWDAFEVLKLKTWSKGRVAILGDGAHAMPPYLGQGGGCALMNALGLAVALDEHADVSEALAAWEARERPLTEHTQDTAERLGDMNYWPDDVRSQVLKITGKCAPLGAERMKTALHIPTGAA
ncbi:MULTISPECIES: FAD-dependent oxidoreductase [Brucella]|jgi:2-polyprenyl-6-methoxyphenol hydroxylase-like FAD-dependent oxidoreductase|uniref:FAD-dependent monooxygenase n=1 Tax=Brucella anthropi TaxID=529 RepID=A0A6I0D5D6_BRUAN|nr:NAD(P)/FAD-dependent oxidoreductase [Brucella anthropi]KAB2778277.1 FAD-dependent monooxygenase [Brucella anthropi]KAB2796159.1 FAD-dependent monooxygenase [Brucella anthropi]MBA8861467.1 2-polyprenyl-6-methoxyphenol hydroxylase-like FAD-dependent oxidoreductase [Brucella anthropi]MDG9792966.1 FAD-dependent monooxygenase [Brucella anthropi]MDH0582832.1 FAD-dependent monooxygenase [Brucella anthropi]